MTPTVVNAATDHLFHAFDAGHTGSVPKHGIQDSSGTDFSAYTAGEWLRVEPANNTSGTDPFNANTGTLSGGGYFRVKENLNSGAGLELEGTKITADDACAATGPFREESSKYVNGVAERSFTIEKLFNDLSVAEGEQATGMTVGSFSLSVSPESIITSTFSFMGKDVKQLASLTDGSPTAASTQKILSAVDHVAGVYIKTGTTGAPSYLRPLDGVTSFELNVENNLRSRTEIGELGSQSIGQGSINVTGSLTVYYDEDSGDIAESIYQGFEDSALSIVLEEEKVNEAKNFAAQGTANVTPAVVFEMPRIKITSLTRNATGTGSDVMAEIGFTAFFDSTTDGTIKLHHFS